MNIKPITLPLEWPDIDCPRKRIQKKIPVIGYVIGIFFASKWLTLDRMVSKELKSREIAFDDLWSDYPKLSNIAKEVQEILKEQLWGFYPKFAPEDSYLLLGQLCTGDLCEVEAIMTLEEYFKIDFPDEENFFDKSMLELIEYINIKKP